MGFRINGIDTPFGGISWEYTEKEKDGIQELFYYLEAKRILVNPADLEIKNWCEQSAIEIRNKLTELLSKYAFSEQTIQCIRSMIGACNIFLDKMSKVDEQGIIYKNQHGDWANSNFSSAMKQFRKTFRDNIKALSSTYDLPFNKEIPEQY